MRRAACIIILLAVAVPLSSQMPDWFTVRDRDGNEYFMDRNGKIWTSGSPDFSYKPASIEGLDYFVTQGVDLIRRHYPAEGLTMLKSVMALPVSNKTIYDAQVKASRAIQALQRREGTRYTALSERASLVYYREGEAVTLHNDRMNWTIRFPRPVTVIRRSARTRNGYLRQGVLVGVTFAPRPPEAASEAPKYDALVAIDSEQFPFELTSVKKLEAHWSNALGGAETDRHLDHRAPDRAVYHCRDKRPGEYSWYEGYYVNGRFGTMVRMIMETGAEGRHGRAMLQALKDFKH